MSNTPKIRFDGFTEDWKQYDLGKVAKYRNGKAHENAIAEQGKYIVVNSKFVSTNGYVRKFSDKQIEPLFKNEIAFVLSDVPNGRAIARTYLVEEDDKYTLNQRIAGITPGENVAPYFLHILMNRNKYFLQFDDGAKQTNLSVENVMKFEDYYPSKPEQYKIGEYFETIDRFITLHESEHEKLVAMKSACLGKMFPNNDNKIPEVRFAGLTGNWNQCKLGTMGTTFTGLSGKTKEDFGHGEGRFVTYMNVYLNPVSDIVRTDLVEIDTSQNAVQYGDVFFTTSSETPEEVGMSSVWLGKSDNVYLNSFCFGFRPTMEIDPLYMAYMLRSEAVRKKIIYLAQGISRYNISKNRVMEIEVPLPDLEEQKLIGQYFNSLDKLIALHQCKLEKFKQVKQSMLHNMFV